MRMSVGAVWALVLVLAWLSPNGLAEAVVTASWTVDSYTAWDEGEAESALITSAGEVKAGWKTRRLALDADGIWAALRAADGSIILGTDDGGAVYRVDGGTAKKLVSIQGAVAVVSLAQAKDGTVYAGTMPGGQIWRLDARSGKATKLVTLKGAETVWALVMDTAGKTLYAGTGPTGVLYAVNPRSGAAKAVFETDDKRIVSLAAAADGSIWLGTSEKALVFRHDPARGTTRAMADFSGNEITAIATAADGVIVAANHLEEPATTGIKTSSAVAKAMQEPDRGEKPQMPKAGTKPGADKATPQDAEPPRKRARKGKGALFHVHGDGRLAQLHALTGTYFTSIAVTESGAIFAGAADKGRIYLVDTDDSVSTAFDVEERMIAALLYDAGSGLTFATGNASALYRTGGKADKATYLSMVYDTKAPSRFGKIVWHGSGNLKIETRTGYTAKPDKGWSEFIAPKGMSPRGGGSQGGQISSPSGRYVQFRVTFSGSPDEVLRKTKVYFLPQNKPTRITELTLSPASDISGVTLKEGATEPRSPIMKIKWSVDNPDNDKTRYELAVRREGDALWRTIVTGKKVLVAKSYDWNTETFPDGYYRLRVTAIDDQATSADRALQSDKTTGLFLVDNERPRITDINVSYPRASARAVDGMSPIAEMAYSVDDGPWLVGTTSDGIFDDVAELLRIALPKDLTPGVHTLAIRAADEAGNIGSASITFRVK